MLSIDPVRTGLLTLIKRSCNCPVGLYGFGMGVNVRTRYFPPCWNWLRPEGRRGSQAQCYVSATT
jgi:hypothetical protein